MRRSSLEWLCFFIAVVQRGSSVLRTCTFRTRRIFWRQYMTGSQRGFAAADISVAARSMSLRWSAEIERTKLQIGARPDKRRNARAG
jgi:hypothetical protein